MAAPSGPSGDGWFTYKDYIKETGAGQRAAFTRLEGLYKQGVLERCKCSVLADDGTVRLTVFFRKKN